jgi:hypothetical protein
MEVLGLVGNMMMMMMMMMMMCCSDAGCAVCRAFRLYLSSKFGKTACLRLSNRFGGATLDPQAAFNHLLISVLHHSSSSSKGVAALAAVAGSAELAVLKRQQWHRVSGGAAAAAGSSCRPVSLLQVEEPQWQQELQQLPLSWQQVPMLQLNPTPHNGSSQQLQDGQLVAHHQQLGQCIGGSLQSERQAWGNAVPAAAAGGAVVCYGPSPYPLLEKFIVSVCIQVRPGVLLRFHQCANVFSMPKSQ